MLLGGAHHVLIVNVGAFSRFCEVLEAVFHAEKLMFRWCTVQRMVAACDSQTSASFDLKMKQSLRMDYGVWTGWL